MLLDQFENGTTSNPRTQSKILKVLCHGRFGWERAKPTITIHQKDVANIELGE